MSDVGLFPPGAMAWFCALAVLAVNSCAFVACVIVVWFRANRRGVPWQRDRFVGHALGALSSSLAAGFTMWLIDYSGSLGVFARWIDRTNTTIAWTAVVIGFGPAVAFVWNRPRNPKAGRLPA